MPAYDFTCSTDSGGCGKEFEIICNMDEVGSIKPECPDCKQQDPVVRNWNSCKVSPLPKTLGMLADQNAAKLSSDEKKYLKEKYKTKKEGPKLKPRR